MKMTDKKTKYWQVQFTLNNGMQFIHEVSRSQRAKISKFAREADDEMVYQFKDLHGAECYYYVRDVSSVVIESTMALRKDNNI